MAPALRHVLLHVDSPTVDRAPDLAKRLGVGEVTRGPLEALARSIPLVPGELAFVCDIVRVADGRLVDAAVSITPAEIEAVGEACRNLPGFRWHGVAGSRHVVRYVGGWPFDLRTRPPAAALGKAVADFELYGAGDEVIREIVALSADVLGGGQRVWLWGPGPLPDVRRIGPGVAMIAETPWARALGRQLGLALPDADDPIAGTLAALERHGHVVTHVADDADAVEAALTDVLSQIGDVRLTVARA